MPPSCPSTLTVLSLVLSCGNPGAPEPPRPVHVTVVVILATDRNATVDPRLKDLAEELRQNLDPSLTGLRVVGCPCKSLPPGASADFALPCGQTVRVTIEEGVDAENRVRVRVSPPLMGDVKYTAACGGFLPIVTRYRTKDDERLILAVRVQPCTKGK
jgi:hypothetical protein